MRIFTSLIFLLILLAAPQRGETATGRNETPKAKEAAVCQAGEVCTIFMENESTATAVCIGGVFRIETLAPDTVKITCG